MFPNRTVGAQSLRKLQRSVGLLRFEGQKRTTVGWHLIRFTLWPPRDSEEQFGQTEAHGVKRFSDSEWFVVNGEITRQLMAISLIIPV